jgi:hypothetical protein
MIDALEGIHGVLETIAVSRKKPRNWLCARIVINSVQIREDISGGIKFSE